MHFFADQRGNRTTNELTQLAFCSGLTLYHLLDLFDLATDHNLLHVLAFLSSFRRQITNLDDYQSRSCAKFAAAKVSSKIRVWIPGTNLI